MWDVIFDKYLVFLMIFSRMSGMILFNPFLSRKNVPVIIKAGLAFFLAMVLTAPTDGSGIGYVSMLEFVITCAKELLIGFFVGFIMQIFMSAVLLGGDFIDLQLGIGMSKVYDPQSNVSMPVTGSMLNLFYIVVFFAANGHLTLIKAMAYSFEFLPLGPALLNPQAWEYAVMFFSNIFILALKIALPIIAIEIITEIGLGTLMRTTPQINVFVVGLQLKLLVGLFLMVLVIPGLFEFLDGMTSRMFESVFAGLKHLTV